MKWSFPKQTPSFLSQALVAPSAFHRGERTWTVTLRGFPVMPCDTAQASPSSGTRRIQSTLADLGRRQGSVSLSCHPAGGTEAAAQQPTPPLRSCAHNLSPSGFPTGHGA